MVQRQDETATTIVLVTASQQHPMTMATYIATKRVIAATGVPMETAMLTTIFILIHTRMHTCITNMLPTLEIKDPMNLLIEALHISTAFHLRLAVQDKILWYSKVIITVTLILRVIYRDVTSMPPKLILNRLW